MPSFHSGMPHAMPLDGLALIAGTVVVLALVIAVRAPANAQPRTKPTSRPSAKLASKPRLRSLPFKDNAAFFEYQCRFGITKIVEGRALVALVANDVTDIDIGFGAAPADMPRVYQITLASPGADQTTFAPCGQGGIHLRPGDLVAWMPTRFVPALGKWQGVIFATLAAEIRDDELVPLALFPPA